MRRTAGITSDDQITFSDGAVGDARLDSGVGDAQMQPGDVLVETGGNPSCSPVCVIGSPCSAGSQCASGACGNGACGYAPSCLAILTANPTAMSATYPIDPSDIWDGGPFSAYCDMTNFDGGWTLVGSMVSAGFDYAQSLTPQPGIATMATNLFGTQPQGSIGRLSVQGQNGTFAFDLAMPAASQSSMAFPTTQTQSGFGPYSQVLAVTNAAFPIGIVRAGLGLSGGYEPPAHSGGFIEVTGAAGATIAGVSYASGVLWVPDDYQCQGCFPLPNTMEITAATGGGGQEPTGVAAEGLYLYYR
jgi:hypothetical protein